MLINQRAVGGKKKLYEHLVRFFPAGNYNWTVPSGCTSIDVFLVGGGGSGGGSDSPARLGGGGGGGYTKTYLNIAVSVGQVIPIIVGKGGVGVHGGSNNGEFSQFLNASYRANGGNAGMTASGTGLNGVTGGSGGSGGSSARSTTLVETGGSDGSTPFGGGSGQGSTTRDFGTGHRNAGGGGGCSYSGMGGNGGASDYAQGRGQDGKANGTQGKGGGGYGGGGGGAQHYRIEEGHGIGGSGGDGTILLRFLSTQMP